MSFHGGAPLGLPICTRRAQDVFYQAAFFKLRIRLPLERGSAAIMAPRSPESLLFSGPAIRKALRKPRKVRSSVLR